MKVKTREHSNKTTAKAKKHLQIFHGQTTPGENPGPAATRRLEKLISKLLTQFVKISVEQIDSEIKVFIRRIIEILGLDRGFLLQALDGGSRMLCTHCWAEQGCAQATACPGPANAPWLHRKILSGERIVISSMGDLPDEAVMEREYFNMTGTKSLISLPMDIEGFVIGWLIVESVRAEYFWSEDVVAKLKTVADVFAGAMERKRRKLELVERLRFETMLNNISARFIRLDAGEIVREIEWALRQICELFYGDRCGILEVQPDRKLVRVLHAWYAEGIERVSEDINLALLFPWCYQMLVEQGLTICFSNPSELPPEAEKDRQSYTAMGVRSCLDIPFFIGDRVHYILAFQNINREHICMEEYVQRLRQLGEIFVHALMRKDTEEKLRKSYEEIRTLKDKLQVEAEYLRSEIKLSQSHEKIIGQSEALVKVLKLVEQVAPTDSTVLICGETGTGKELVARAIHSLSPYADKVMVKVNCASLPAPLVESELFGREKGAYTGALTRQIGRFEMADGSSIFLDEIAELSLELQAKLLRVLQEGQFERLGSPKTIHVRVRIIAATNRNIVEEVKKGNFREDLFYRLNVFPITVPPLRHRLDDIPMLVWAFVNEFGDKMGKKINKVTRRDMEALQQYGWPGNIRELRNVIEHAVIVSNCDTLNVKVPKNDGNETFRIKTLEEMETQHIIEVLRHTEGRIKGPLGAAQLLGMNPSTLYSRIQKLGVKIHNEKDGLSN